MWGNHVVEVVKRASKIPSMLGLIRKLKSLHNITFHCVLF